METAATLIQCENDTAAPSDPAVMSVYRILQRRFETLLDDNKRLYAYLSHEQKNTIAVLRTSLELSGHIEYLDAMDDLSNGIDDILTLSETASTAAAVPIDAALICAEVYDKYKKVYEQLSFDFDGDEDTEIMAKSRWIYRAVSSIGQRDQIRVWKPNRFFSRCGKGQCHCKGTGPRDWHRGSPTGKNLSRPLSNQRIK